MSSQSSDTAKGDSGEALVKMREAFWQHVLVRHKLIDEDRWKTFIEAYEQFGRHEPIEQWLLNEGVVKAEQVKPLRLAVKNLIWGQILVRNNLITKEQWSEVQKTLKANGSGGSVGKILVENKMLSKELVDLARKRVSFTLGSFDSSQASAAKPSAAPAKAAADEDVDLVELEEVGGDTEPAPQAAAPAAADSSDDEYSLADGDDLSSDAAHRGDELTWVGDSKSTEDDQESSDWADDMMPQIDLADGNEVDAGEEKKISVVEGPGVGRGAKATKSAAPPPSPKPSAAPPQVSADAVVSEEDRIPSPVPPNQLDPTAVDILRLCVGKGASDIHLASGSPPFMRLHGELTFLEMDRLTADQVRTMALGFMDDPQQQTFLRHHDLDMSWEHPQLGRFRVNALEQFRGPDIIFRCIASKVPTLEELGLPEQIGALMDWPQGLVLVTGPTGCGKSTTAAAFVDLVNERRRDHIITVEEPVEILHPCKNCNVTQRQVPNDTESFARALKAALREDPDVIMIGEMRDLETISLAMTAAETGHLVIGTLHTSSAARTVDRVVDVFPTDQQAQVRVMLAEGLRAIITQQLVPRADGNGRVVALEVLYNTGAIANLIRDGKSFQIASMMQTGKKKGMVLMDDSLAELVNSGTIKREDAIKIAENPKNIPGG